MPNAVLEVAVMGSTPNSRVVTGALNMYTPPDKKGSLTIPHGGRVGRWMSSFLDENSVLLNYRYGSP
jgi:hypothetical protein